VLLDKRNHLEWIFRAVAGQRYHLKLELVAGLLCFVAAP
jgi:hypothetical protein